MRPLVISSFSIVSSLGLGSATTAEALRRERSGLRCNDFEHAPLLQTSVGRVEDVERHPVREPLERYDCRNNRLVELALQVDGFGAAADAASRRYTPERVGVFFGTSTSGCLETELAYRRLDPATGALPDWLDFRHQHSLYSATDYTRRRLGLRGPAIAISTACSSSAKAFATAARHIQAGLCDAAVVGGADSLCLNTLYGFHSLELSSTQPCRPFDQSRDGISIGEGAGFALLEARTARPGEILFSGYGESSDAYHMASPHPDGLGAVAAMTGALACAALQAGDVDYVNAHGTGTPANDVAEDRAIAQVFGTRTPVSSSKGWTGHTLGAAGIVEAVICCIALREQLRPGTLNTRTVDPACASNIVTSTSSQPLHTVLSNSFGFGGNNCSLVFRRQR